MQPPKIVSAEQLRQKIRIAELASEDQRLTRETRELGGGDYGGRFSGNYDGRYARPSGLIAGRGEAPTGERA